MAIPFRLRALLVGLAAVPLLAGCGPDIPATIKIGVAQPLSGPSAARGQDLLNGAKLAVNDINASGYKIAGKNVRLEIVAVDDKGEAAQAKKVAQDLVDQKVYAVLGHLSSDITEATIPIYKQGDVVQFFTSSAAELTKLGEGNAFRLVANDLLQAKAIAAYATDTLKATRLAIVNEDTTYGTPMKKDVVTELTRLKKSVDLQESSDNKATDFTAFVGKLKANRPDVLVAIMREHQLLPLFKQMNEAGLADLPVIVASAAKTTKLAAAPVDVQRLYVTSSSLDPSDFAAGRQFADRFRDVYKADPVWAAHYAYDAVHVLTYTLRNIGTVDKDTLRSKLRVIDAVAPVTGTMRFDASGEQRFAAISVYQRRDGRWESLGRSDQW